MECVEVALKTSFMKEMGLNLSPQVSSDEQGSLFGQNGVAFDDFSVDELLDFSNEDGFEDKEPDEREEEEEENKGSSSVCISTQGNCHGHEILKENACFPLPTSELAVPAEDVADLEWLSHFVEDSFSEYSALFPAGILAGKPKEENGIMLEPEAVVSSQPCFKTPVPAKARSKRTRTGGRVWCLSSPSLTDSCSSSTTSSSSSSPPPSPWLIYNTSVPTHGPTEPVWLLEKIPAKKLKKKVGDGVVGGGGQTPRRCSHCGVQKTPQWRAGPLGAKTLCNACGVRFKSGRLFPEYRPACSPTFSSEMHSNHHRKVLEMRRKKETVGVSEPGFTPVVPSF